MWSVVSQTYCSTHTYISVSVEQYTGSGQLGRPCKFEFEEEEQDIAHNWTDVWVTESGRHLQLILRS